MLLGTVDPTPCEPGTYGQLTGQISLANSCSACPETNFCPYFSMTTDDLEQCLDRYFCDGSVIGNPIDALMGHICESGNFCLAGIEEPCPPGKFMPVKGMSRQN